MKARLISSLLVVWFASHGTAQTTPSSLTKVGTYSSATLGLSAGAGGFEFDSAGKTLYINDPVADRVMSVTVVRNTSGRITGFKSPVVLVASKSSGTAVLDGGLDRDVLGTFFLTNYGNAELEQYSPSTKAHTVTNLKNLGFTGSPGGAELLVRNRSLLVSDYDSGGIYELPLKLTSNLTYTVGKATSYLPTPTGVEGFEFVPKGPFDKTRGLVVVNYDNARVDLVGIDPTTSKPFLDASGAAFFVPLITGLSEPMDIEFDPITNDLFISDYSSKTATLLQFSGEIRGGFDGAFDLFGPGCPQKSGAVPTLGTSAKLRIGLPVTFQLSKAPANQSRSFLVFGIGSVGNLGGFLFIGTTCRVHANPMVSVPVPTNASGVGSFTVTIPKEALGITLFTQAYALSTGANSLNLTVSDAAVSLIGR
ncbi:MAG: hypothetical protein ACYTGW_03575 [Planctomycetota bacterium]|jgi:hypothetical protein